MSTRVRTSNPGCAIAVGLLFLFFGWSALMPRLELVLHGVKTMGQVTENVKSVSNKNRVSYQPRIEFKTPDGKVYSFVSAYGETFPKYTVGQPVEILYSAEHPGSGLSEINNPWTIWVIPGGLLLVAGLCLVPTAIDLIKKRRMHI